MADAARDANSVPTLMVWDGTTMQRALADTTGRLLTGAASGLPSGATPINGSSGNVAAGAAVATLTGSAGVFTWITGFQMQALGATGLLTVLPTVAGVQTGTITYLFTFPAGATVRATDLVVSFPIPVRSSAVNTSIVVTLPSGGAGNTNAVCNAQGYLL